jgi:hypothetical protein
MRGEFIRRKYDPNIRGVLRAELRGCVKTGGGRVSAKMVVFWL